MTFISDIITRRDNIATELAAVRNTANHEYVLRLWEELRHWDALLQSPMLTVTSADDFDPFEVITQGMT